MAGSSTAQTAARGTLLSIALRLLSFLLSQLTVRYVSASVLGKASIPLELLLSTSLFVGREGFRLALTREIDENDDENDENEDRREDDEAKKRRNIERDDAMRDQQIVNVSWLTVPVGAILSSLAMYTHLRGCDGSNEDVTSSSWDYELAGMLYCLASFVECISEPLVIRCMRRMDVATKARAEGAALIAKSLCCFVCLYYNGRGWHAGIIKAVGGHSGTDGASSMASDFSVTAFGISQLVYASVFTSIMYRGAWSSKGGIHWPKNIKESMSNPYSGADDGRHVSQHPTRYRNFHGRTLYLVFVFTLQGLFKHALTEADKFVLSRCAGSYDQGVYALAASYGGE